MQRAIKIIFFLFIITNAWAAAPTNTWYTKIDNQVNLRVDIFMSSTCPHCHKADAFLRTLQSQVPWLTVNRFVINKDKQALSYFYQTLQHFEIKDFSVPAIFFCGVRWVGFESAETSGKELEESLKYCRQQIIKEGDLKPLTVAVLKRKTPAPYDISEESKPSAFTVIAGTALLDAINPCSFFAVSAFLAFLLLLPTRRGKLIAGMLMLFIIILSHYLQAQAAIYYPLLIGLRIPALIVGGALLALSLIPAWIRKENLLFIFAPITVFIVFMYQQTCSANNFSLFFEQWLMTHSTGALQQILYQMAYQAIYLLPLVIILVLCIYFLSGSYLSRFPTRVAFIGRMYLFLLGLLLAIYPRALADFYLSLLLLASVTVIAWLASKKKMQR